MANDFISQLAQTLPVILSGMTKNPQTVMNTIKMSQMGQQQAAARNLRQFGRELFSSGVDFSQPGADQQIQQLAGKYGLNPVDAIDLITRFSQYRATMQPSTRKFSRVLPGGQINQVEAVESPGDDFMPGTISGQPRYNKFSRTLNDGRVNQVEALESPGDEFMPGTITGRPPTGTTLKTDKDGGVFFQTGVPGQDSIQYAQNDQINVRPEEFTAKTKNDIQSILVKGREGIARIDRMISNYDERFLNKWVRAKNAKNNLLESWGLAELSPAQKQELGEYTTMARTSIENINTYIHDMTGAQMSEFEAKRLRLAVPDFGDAWWKGDGPTKYYHKMMDIKKALIEQQWRLAYMLKHGLEIKRVVGEDGKQDVIFLDEEGRTLDHRDMPKIINQRGEELAKQGYEQEEIDAMIADEFDMTGGGI